LADPHTDIPPLLAQLRGWRWRETQSSPSRRCREVAERIRLPVRIDPRLQELDFGAWEGCAWDDLPREALDRWAADPVGFAPPGGESGADLIARVSSFAADLVAGDGDCIVVSHGGPLKILVPLLWSFFGRHGGDGSCKRSAIVQAVPELRPHLLAAAPPLGSVTIVQTK
jgi:alpha-ribazole phosphatase